MAKQFQGKKNMDVVTWTGNGGTQSISGLDFSPDLVWVKQRNGTAWHIVHDTVRPDSEYGVSPALYPNDPQQEQDTSNTITGWTSDGFTVGSGSQTNSSGDTYVAWCWDAGDETEVITPGALNSELYNQDEVWSSLGSVSSSGQAAENYTALFDGSAPGVGGSLSGNGSNGWRIGGLQTSVGSETVSGLNIPFTSSVKIRYTKAIYSGNNNNAPFLINGVDVLDGSNTDETVREMEVSDLITSPITSLEIARTTGGNNNLLIYQISIDGKILADANATLSPLPSVETTVRANPEAGFSVVTYTGNGDYTGNTNFGHGLNKVPQFAIIKSRTDGAYWECYHSGLDDNKLLYLNTTDAQQTTSAWGTGPTSDVFTVGDSYTNLDGQDYVAYVWSEVPGYSKFGRYYGNGYSANSVYTGFKPAWVMIKRIDSTDHWFMYDNKRDGLQYNQLIANSSDTEYSATDYPGLEFTSNGFRLISNNTGRNGDSATYVYMAFAERPFSAPQKVELEFEDTQDFREILNGDTLTEYTQAGPGASGVVNSKDTLTNKVVVLGADASDFTTDNTRSMTKPVTPPSNQRWSWSAWVKRSNGGESQTLFKSDRFIVGFNDKSQLFAGVVPVDVYFTTLGAGSTLAQIVGGGTLWTGQNLASNESVVLVNRDHGVAGPRSMYTGSDMNLGLRTYDPAGFYTADGTQLGGTGSFAGHEFPLYFSWVNEGTIGTDTYGIPTNNNVAYTYMMNYTNTAGEIFQPGIGYGIVSEETFYDQSTWVHVTVTCDTLSGEGFRMYVNGERVTDFSSELQPGLNYSVPLNTTGIEQSIGSKKSYEYSGYVADVQFYDGQTINSGDIVYNASFREDQLYPLKPSKWFGTRGYHLDFANPSDLGNDIASDDDWNSLGDSSSPYAGKTFGEQVYQATSGTDGSDFWTNITPSDAKLNYNSIGGVDPTNAFSVLFNGRATNANSDNVEWVGVGQYQWGNVSSADFDLTSLGEINTIRIWSGAYDYSTYGRYAFEILDNNGTVLGTTLPTSQPSAEFGWDSLTWTGDTPATLRIRTYGGQANGYRLRFGAIEVNGIILTNDMPITVEAVVDTPNNYGEDDGLGGEQRGNYGTWNSHDIRDIGTQPTQMWNGNLSWGDRGQSNSYGSIIGNFPMGSGKWYWEITLGSGGSAIDTTTYMGIVPLEDVQGYWQGNIFSAYMDAYSIKAGTRAWTGSGDEQTGYLSGTPAEGTVYSFALDTDTGNLEVWMNGVSGGNFPFAIPAGKTWVPFVSDWSNASTVNEFTANFGATEFAYPAPAGYKTMNTNNIEDGLVLHGNTAMDVVTYTGNATARDITGFKFSPDLVWIRCRDAQRSFILSDSVRGANKCLIGNTADVEFTDSTYVTSFNDDGFSLGTAADVNRDATNMVAWAWDAGDSDPVLNTTGSLASTVKANPTKGFSIVTWDYSGQTNYTVGHGLGVKPSMIIAKNRTGGNSWRVHHKSLNNNMIVYMDTTGLQENSANIIATPTSSVITTTGNGTGNASGSSVAYCWSEVPGYSAFGSYYGNVSNGDGTIFIHTGFKPRWIMIKQFAGGNNGGGSWVVFDTRRDEFNPLRSALYLNSTQAEDLSYPIGNSLDNGFHITQSSPIWNWDGNVYLYAAFAENPTQYMPQ